MTKNNEPEHGSLVSRSSIDTVSYTHLDVYKRQIYKSPKCGGRQNLEN